MVDVKGKEKTQIEDILVWRLYKIYNKMPSSSPSLGISIGISSSVIKSPWDESTPAAEEMMPGQQVQGDANGASVTPDWGMAQCRAAVSHLHESSRWGQRHLSCTAKSYCHVLQLPCWSLFGCSDEILVRDPLEIGKWEEERRWDRVVGIQ